MVTTQRRHHRRNRVYTKAPLTPELEAAGRRQLRLWRGGDGSVEEVEAALERLQERYGEEVALRVRPELPASPIAAQRYALVPK